MDFRYELKAAANGKKYVCGVDEAGRGPLAGPVYAAAVILPAGLEISGLDDSKKLSAGKREELFDIICEKAAAWSIASADEKTIDEINILQAVFLAMRKAIEGLCLPADYALIDGDRKPPLKIECETIIKGDSLCPSIAAASILAKVGRDRFMLELDKKYPQYLFARHKGYGTKEHYKRLEEYGISDCHRRSFLKKLTGGKR